MQWQVDLPRELNTSKISYSFVFFRLLENGEWKTANISFLSKTINLNSD